MNLEQTLQYIEKADDKTLFVLWTNADPVTANLMVFMYVENSMKYQKWEHISVIIWGATTKLAAENPEIQARIRTLQDLGVHFTACISCAKELNVENKLEAMGIDLIKWLEPMTALIKGGKKFIAI